MRKRKNANDDESQQHGGCCIAAQSQPAEIIGFVQKITDHRSQRPGEHKGCPKQHCSGNVRPIIGRNDHHQQATEYQRTATIAQSDGIGSPVTQGRAQGL